MKKFLFLSIILFSGILWAQVPGSGSGSSLDQVSFSKASRSMAAVQSGDFIYSTSTYTFNDIVVFSYFDNSAFKVFDASGVAVDSVMLNKDEFYSFKPGKGSYRVDCNNSFTVLIGDPITRSVMGFFAVDESGSPLSTHINTFMPANDFPNEHFIVFAYHDGTELVVKNLTDSTTIAAVILNRGEHLEINDVNSKFLQVSAGKPVSALSYTDQGYYIPSDNGTFAGTNFYGFSGYVGNWSNGVVISAYQDSTIYLLTNTETGDTLMADTLNYGEVASYAVSGDLYWQVQTNKNVTVSNTPYAAWTGSYFYLTRQIDESGEGIGRHFIMPVIYGDTDIYSFADNNTVMVIDLASGDTVYTEMLNRGDHFYFGSANTVYNVIATENISVITSNGASYGADFVPLNFAIGLPDLAISGGDIDFDPDTVSATPGTPVTINATVHNYGFETAYEVSVQFYDGRPEANNAISTFFIIDSLAPGASKTLSVDWLTPDLPEYHEIYVVVDQHDYIVESNESNNTGSRFLIANKDLLPPLAVVVNAPGTVILDNDTLSFTDFDIEVSIYNSGDVAADSVLASLRLPLELSIRDSVDSLMTFDSISAKNTVKFFWPIHIDGFPSSTFSKISGSDDILAYFYTITVSASNAETKDVNRMLLVKDNSIVGINGEEFTLPENFEVAQNYPNPFNPVTRIDYALPQAGHMLIRVFDLSGRKVAELQNGNQTAGRHSVSFNGKDLSSGIYFMQLNFNGRDVAVLRMTLLK